MLQYSLLYCFGISSAREFIKRNGEFTVNIALIEHSKPILGVIYVPATKTIHVNVSKANNRTIAHEIFHAITDQVFKGSQKALTEFTNTMIEDVKPSRIWAQIYFYKPTKSS